MRKTHTRGLIDTCYNEIAKEVLASDKQQVARKYKISYSAVDRALILAGYPERSSPTTLARIKGGYKLQKKIPGATIWKNISPEDLPALVVQGITYLLEQVNAGKKVAEEFSQLKTVYQKALDKIALLEGQLKLQKKLVNDQLLARAKDAMIEFSKD